MLDWLPHVDGGQRNVMDEPDQRIARERADALPARTADYDQLRVSEMRYRRLFEAAQDGVLLIDPDTRKITDANPFMTKLLGYSHDQLVGKELYEIGLLKDERASQDMFIELKKNGQVRYEDLPLASQAGGHQEVEVVANVYDENGRSVIQCNIRDITVRKQREAHNKLLIAEVNHRARNLLAVVQVIAQQTATHADQATFVTRMTERIGGLAASQDLLVENEWHGVAVAELVKAQLAHFKDLFGTRVHFDRAPVRLKPSAAQGIGMALHELATNAGKYGALSNSEGHVHVSWQVSMANIFSMSWMEERGPTVVPPTHKGFGQTVIEDLVEAAVDGTTEIDYPASGFTWKLQAPIESIAEPVTADREEVSMKTRQPPRILIVEDEPIIAFGLRDLLTGSGFEIAGVSGNLKKALALIELGDCDAAIIDANLDGVSASPAGVALAARGLPFLVLSGYSAKQQKGAFPAAALFLQKPCPPDRLVEALNEILICQ